MKKKEFKKLKVGDKVTIRTKEEMLALKHTFTDRDGDIFSTKSEGFPHFFIVSKNGEEKMEEFCGKECTVKSVGRFSIRICESQTLWEFNRKMLRGKYE